MSREVTEKIQNNVKCRNCGFSSFASSSKENEEADVASRISNIDTE